MQKKLLYKSIRRNIVHILVLEDDHYRNKKFKQELIGNIVDFSETADDAIQKINSTTYDLIFLDHDLGGEIYVDSTEKNTGYQVAKVIPETQNKHACIILHTMNIVGSDNMKAVLPDALKIPFTVLDIREVVDRVKEVFKID